MAFSRDNFGPIGNVSKRGAAPVMWGYKSADAIATVNTSGYFDSVSDLVTVGDMIYCFDTATPTANLVIVLSNASGVVDVSDGTAVTVADAD
jgi:hypothetical protein